MMYGKNDKKNHPYLLKENRIAEKKLREKKDRVQSCSNFLKFPICC